MSHCRVITGLERLQVDGYRSLAGQRVGLVAHPAAVDHRLVNTATILFAATEVDLRSLFGPQHGIRGETQDNMVEWEGFRDPATSLPAYSLYGQVRKPTTEMLAEIDTLVIDLQDVGARYYTFVWTMLLCLQACAGGGKRVVVLDRPNPLGGAITEGTLLEPEYYSFVGMAPVPMRHGLTLGEMAESLRRQFKIDVDLEVVWLEGWRRSQWFDETGLPWVMPSPNMPTLDTAVVYPGFCLLEGTELSEGRGTTRPFEIFGAPFIEPRALVGRVMSWQLPGFVLRPVHFQPTFQKHAGQICGGAQLHVTDRNEFRSVTAAAAVLSAVRELWPDDFQWRQPPYEYETVKLPIDILAGGPRFRQEIDAGRSPVAMAAEWDTGLTAYSAQAREFHHYA